MPIIENLTFAEYQAIDAVNWSTLKYMAASAMHYRHALDNERPDTSAMEMGRAAHCAVLEPDEFPRRYVLWTGGTRRGKAWDEFCVQHEDKEILREADYDRALAIRDAVHGHELAKSLLYGRSEVVALWTDEATGIECKARIDHINADGEFIDLKTTKCVDQFEFERTSGRMLYHCQLAFYRRGVGNLLRPRIIAAEYDAPHDVAVFRLTDDAVYAGDQHVEELLRRLAMYRESDKWPGRYAAEQDLSIPPWLLDEDGDSSLGFSIGGTNV